MQYRLASILTFVVLIFTSNFTIVRGQNEGLEQAIEKYDQRFSKQNRLSGVLCVAVDGKIVHRKAYGQANYELGVSNQIENRFCIASVTKAFTKTVFIQMLIEGKLKLDDPLSKWLPDFPNAGEITIEHLLRFQAGIPHRVTTDQEESGSYNAEAMTNKIASHVAEHGFLSEPGKTSSYSSASYSVLARIAELIDDKRFSDILASRIFKVAGMEHSLDLVDHGSLIPRRVSSYVAGLDEILNAPVRDVSFLVGAGSVYSTADDLLKFALAIKDDSKFHPAIRQSLADDDGLHLTGATHGFFAFVDDVDEHGITVVFVGNSWGGCAGQIRSEMVSIVKGEVPRTPVFPDFDFAHPTTSTELEELLGSYRTRPGAFIEVTKKQNQLFVSDSVVIPIGKDRYFHQVWHIPIRFVRNEKSEVVAIRREFDGATDELKRFHRKD